MDFQFEKNPDCLLKLSTMTEKLRVVSFLQSQLNGLLNCKIRNDPLHPLLQQVYYLLGKDSVLLFSILNFAIPSLLESLNIMNRKNAETFLSIYTLYCKEVSAMKYLCEYTKDYMESTPEFYEPDSSIKLKIENHISQFSDIPVEPTSIPILPKTRPKKNNLVKISHKKYPKNHPSADESIPTRQIKSVRDIKKLSLSPKQMRHAENRPKEGPLSASEGAQQGHDVYSPIELQLSGSLGNSNPFIGPGVVHSAEVKVLPVSRIPLIFSGNPFVMNTEKDNGKIGISNSQNINTISILT